jgi:hypothetical protein
MTSEAQLAMREAAAELREDVMAAIDAGAHKLPAIARAVGYDTWGRGSRYMSNADRERLKRALAALCRARRAYQDALGRWVPYDHDGHVAVLQVREASYRVSARFHARAGARAEGLADRLRLEALRLEDERDRPCATP